MEMNEELTFGGFRGIFCSLDVSIGLFGLAKLGEGDKPSGKIIVNLKRPPSQMVFSFPGMPHSHCLMSRTPWAFRMGLAKNPNGWSLRHCLLFSKSATEIPSQGSRGSRGWRGSRGPTAPPVDVSDRAPWIYQGVDLI
jgi:hypothetical protein